MPSEQEKKTKEEKPAAKEPELHRAHTYDDDIAKAMNATDAATVQEFLSTAREREAQEKAYRVGKVRRKWYSIFSIFFTICALGAFGYAVYHYYTLTVPVEKSMSVGVFPSTSPIVAGETTIEQTVGAFAADTSLPEGKPILVPLVTDAESLVAISKQDFFSFLKARPTEPFVYSMDSIRLGIFDDERTVTPFIILSVPDPQIASKEFLIAEPTLLQLFYRALGIAPETLETAEIGTSFESTYLYNMPVRMLTAIEPGTGEKKPIILYGYATEHTIVITTKPSVLKAVYDTLIRQQ